MVWETDFATGGAEVAGAFAEEEAEGGDQSAPPTPPTEHSSADEAAMMAEADKTD
jgi:hypothetical protein